MARNFPHSFIVCDCKQVSLGELIYAIKEKGAKTLEDLEDLTDAGSSCGCCKCGETDIGEQKMELYLDDETLDALNEIVSNICGSFCTVTNAQGFSDIGKVKFDIKNKEITEISLIPTTNSFELNVMLDGESNPLVISFSPEIASYFSQITGATKKTIVEEEPKIKAQTLAPTAHSSVQFVPKNLELLQSVKLKLSVRLGTKVVLLKDILRWDVGEIIELEQMVNEPLEVLVNGVKIGEGEAVIVEGKFGLKIKKIGNEELKFAQIGL